MDARPNNAVSVLPQLTSRGRRHYVKRGVTLIELLVVMAVIVLLLGVAVPQLKPVLDRGRIREGARQMNAFFASAEARAIQLGRPAGVWLERRPGDGACLDLSPAEVPPVYTGDFLGATVRCMLDVDTQRWRVEFNQASAMIRRLSETSQELRFLIRFGYRGPLYPVVLLNGDDISSPPVMRIDDNPVDGSRLDPPIAAQNRAVPFQIYQLPQKSNGRTLQLTGGTIVDLAASGFGLRGTEFNSSPPSSLVIMFSPGGGVDTVTAVATGETIRPTGPIHLLVGRLDRSEAANSITNEDGDQSLVSENLSNHESVWISIGHRTGLISSSQNAWLVTPAGDPIFEQSLAESRHLAQTAQTLGGR